jgi:hypothetical protein
MAEYIAASLSPADVRTAFAAASANDVVVLPAGTLGRRGEWNVYEASTAAVVGKNGVSLRGQGLASTMLYQIGGTLLYDAETAPFTQDAILTGVTSGATATIRAVDDAGTTGTLYLSDINGTFQNNETINDSAGGSALANGTVSASSYQTSAFFYWNPSYATPTYALEVSGFRASGSGIFTSSGYGIRIRSHHTINVHHLLVEKKSSVLLAIDDCDSGVVWKNYFQWCILTSSYGSGGYGVAVKGEYPYTWPGSYPEFGTADAIFIEDNEFYGIKQSVEGQDCAKYVFRYNKVSGGWGPHGQILAHGPGVAEDEDTSSLHVEAYGNDITLSTMNLSTFYPHASAGSAIRGGHAMLWNNKFHSWGDSSPNSCVRVNNTDILAHTTPAYTYPADYYIIWQARDYWAWNNTYDGALVNIYEYGSTTWFEENRLSGQLPFDAQTGNFTLNLKVTGATSGAYGWLTKQTDSGTYGTLWLRNVVGTFQNNETITDTSTGSALVNSLTGLQDAYYDYKNSMPEGYAPYIYPHPLRGGNPPAPPPGPVIPPVVKFQTADIGKNIILDWELAQKLEGETWTSAGSGAYYLSFTEGEVTRVAVNGTAYAEKFTVAEVQATASTFFYDLTTSRLYTKTADGDSPSTGTPKKYCFMAYWWKGISNVGVTLARESEILVDGKVDLWSDSATLKNWTKTTTGTGSLAQEATSVYDVNSAYSAKLSAGTGTAGIYQDIVTRPAGWQRVRLKYAGSTAETNVKLQIRNSGSNVYLDDEGNWNASGSISLLPSTEWQEYEIKFQAHASYSAYRISLTADTADFICYTDNAEWKRFYELKFYDPFLRADSIPNLNMSVGTWHEPEEQVSFGTVGFPNDGFWWQKKDTYIWSNKEMEFRIGEPDDVYDDYVPIFFGQSRRPEWTMAGFQVDTKDVRSTLINNCAAIARFDSTTYPNCETAWINRGVPILLGPVESITPPCCNTATFVYKVTQTVFGGATYAQYTLDAVYKGIYTLDEGTDYTKDLNAGTFTLLADPGTDVITCNAKGIKVDFEETGYAFTIAHYLYFFLKRMNGIPESKINLKSFLDLYDKRTIEAREYITDDMDFRELLNKWKRSNSFQTFQSCEGEWFARALTSDVPSNAQDFRNVDFLAFNYWEDTDQIYKYIEVKKDQNPTTGEWEVCINNTISDPKLNRAEWEHGERRTLSLETSISTYYQGTAVANAYGNILNYPLPMIRAVLPARGLLLNPTDKIVVTYRVEMSDGTIVTVFDAQAFIVLTIVKDFQNAQAEVVAVKNVADLSWEV